VAGEFREHGEVTVSAEGEAVIAGDRGQMAQVLRNLIENARKYGGSEKAVSVTVEATRTGWVYVAIKDEGDGIAAEHLPRLTERFYRADTSRSRAAGGTGLGLSIVKHIVERHRGRFDIASRQGEGTTASMMLPAQGS
jgi:two-component system phosphate regulon sensor histidine kinase PhoR